LTIPANLGEKVISYVIRAIRFKYFAKFKVLYGCETWSLATKEEYRLSVFENRVLIKIFEHKTEEITGSGEYIYHKSAAA
jgi:hypothetical protein